MICTSVIPCLSTGLAKNNQIMSMFVLFSRLLGHFESLACFQKLEDKPYTKAVKWDVFSEFSKVGILSNNFLKRCGYFD